MSAAWFAFLQPLNNFDGDQTNVSCAQSHNDVTAAGTSNQVLGNGRPGRFKNYAIRG
jgi:hypothetical protein